MTTGARSPQVRWGLSACALPLASTRGRSRACAAAERDLGPSDPETAPTTAPDSCSIGEEGEAGRAVASGAPLPQLGPAPSWPVSCFTCTYATSSCIVVLFRGACVVCSIRPRNAVFPFAVTYVALLRLGGESLSGRQWRVRAYFRLLSERAPVSLFILCYPALNDKGKKMKALCLWL